MPRTPSGGYDLPAGQPAVPDTLITAEVHNRLANDMAETLEDSLSRTGKGGMLVPFRVADGNEYEPAYSFTNSLSSGMYFDSTNKFLKFAVERFNVLTLEKAKAVIDGTVETKRVEATSEDDLSLSSNTNAIKIGINRAIDIDTHQIQATDNGMPSEIHINPLGGDVLINGHKPAPDQDVYRKSEYLQVSLGIQSQGKPIVLDGTGKIHPTMADLSPFYFVDGFTPIVTAEYPSTATHEAGAFWIIEGLSGQYTFISGDLAGQVCDNGYFMFLGADGWALTYSNVNPSAYYRLDGTNPITENFQAGGYRLTHVAEGIDPSDAVTMSQLGTQSGFYRLDGTTPITAPFQAGGYQMRNIADGTDGKDAATINQIGAFLPKDGTEKMTGSLTIGNGTNGFACYIRGNASNDPRLRFKRTDDTNAGGLRYDSATNSVGVELIDAAGTSEQCLLLLDGTDNTLKFNGSKVFAEADHIDVSAGSGDAGKPIILNGLGQIDPSMIDASTFYFVGEFTPTGGDEYPDETGETPGAFWVVTGLGSGVEYTFTGGDLSGRTIADGDFMVWSTGGWAIMVGEMNPILYYRLDGSQPLTADFEAGGHKLTNVADGTDVADAVTVGQLGGYLPIGDKASDSELLDGIDSASFVRNDDGAQTVHGGFTISNDGAAWSYLYDTTAPADEKRWLLQSFGGVFSIVAVQDDAQGSIEALTFTRTGTTVDSCTIGCDTTVQGRTISLASFETYSDTNSIVIFKQSDGVDRGIVGCNGALGDNRIILRAYNNDGSGAVAGELIISGDNGNASFDKGLHVASDITTNGDVIADIDGDPISLINLGFSQKYASGGFKNKIINGDMKINQRAGTYNTTGMYTLDRWFMGFIGAGSMLVTQEVSVGQTVGLPDYLTHYLRADIIGGTAGGDYSFFGQKIEGAETFVGSNATVSFYAKSNAGQQIVVGGVVSYDDAGVTPDLSLPQTLIQTTTEWAKYEVTIVIPALPAGIVLGANSFLQLDIYGSSEPQGVAQSIVLDITGIQFEAGDVSTSFEKRPHTVEMQLCQYFFNAVRYDMNFAFTEGYNGHWDFSSSFPKMRVVPTCTFSHTSVGTVNFTIDLGEHQTTPSLGDNFVAFGIDAPHTVGSATNIDFHAIMLDAEM